LRTGRNRASGSWGSQLAPDVNEHPTFPAIQPLRTIGTGDVWVSECRFDYGDVALWSICAVQEFRDGKIARITEYFGQPFGAADWRVDIVERIAD
jgi:hypothetical protein